MRISETVAMRHAANYIFRKNIKRKRRVCLLLLTLCVLLAACGAPRVSAPAATPAPAETQPAAIVAIATAPVTLAPVTPTPSATPVPTPVPLPLPFTIVWMPDTQTSVYSQPEAMVAMGQWIHDNREKENIVQVVHTGDLVNNGLKESEWKRFEAGYDLFKDDAPFFCIAGNHDLGVKAHDWSGYLARPYAHTVPETQYFEGGKAGYTLLSSGGVDFIIIGAGSGAELESVDWINEQLAAHRDRVGILMLHEYLHAKYDLRALGESMRSSVVAVNPNVRLVICGHYRGTDYRMDTFTDGPNGSERVVSTMLCNYQHYTGNTGQLRLLRFDPITRNIEVHTFSALSGKTFKDDHFHTDPFILENAF